ncbi:response regulator-like protein with receiver domain [Leptolyngbyaceae cyanobacterium JSC-12]|nr:response regulator-like protein with receiver domain [Leptolyngbyaceae cyanobacterium JSC-12]
MTSSQLSKGDILLVDDTPDNLRLLSTMLISQGYDVRSVRSGSAALMGVQAQPPDLILLDINMPEMNGYEVCERLKSNSETLEIPVIFISALNEVFDKVKAFTVGGVDYISKPFQVEEVLVRVENQLKIRRLQLKLQQALDQERQLNQRIEELAALEERNRIARDIHDSLGHALVALNIQMETAIALWKDNPDKAYEFLVEAKQLGSNALQATRASVSGMRTNPLQGQSLEAAIAALAEEFCRTTGIQPECQIQLAKPLSSKISTVLYRIVQEGLTNIAKHANAASVQINLHSTETGLSLTIQDNGNGFQVDANRTGFGLQGMNERIAALSGKLSITSQPGSGCCITVLLPLESK